MLRLLVMGDLHFTHIPPRSRTVLYPRHVRAKLAWVARTAKKLDVTAVLCTGDIFHRKAPEDRDVTALIRAFRTMPGGRIYSVLGNHDTIRPGDMKDTAYEVMCAAGVVENIDVDVARFSWPAASSLCITGHPWWPEDHERAVNMYGRTTHDGRLELRITHGMLVPENRTYPFAATYPGAIQNPPTLLINGHNHIPFDHKWVVNVGSLVRVSRAEDGRRSVVLVEERDGIVTWRRINVPLPDDTNTWVTAPDIDLGVTAQRDAFHQDINNLVDDLGRHGDALTADPLSLLDTSGLGDVESRAEARRYIETAKEALHT